MIKSTFIGIVLVSILSMGCHGQTAQETTTATATSYTASVDNDMDGFSVTDDCDDSDASVYPGAEELCDDIDNDCDKHVDEGLDGSWFLDADGDGYGDPVNVIGTCDPSKSHVANSDDCDDTSASIYPKAKELCDDLDNDCDGDIDENTYTYFIDSDGDGYGSSDETITDCEPPKGFAGISGDCNDDDAAINPGATEICDDNDVDEDCNGYIDDADIDVDESSYLTWYTDADQDGFGTGKGFEQCDGSKNETLEAGDCNDSDGSISPLAAERCNDADDNCDGIIDNNPVDGDTWYADTDSDGYGDPKSSMRACSQPKGYVADATDCDDSDSSVGDCGDTGLVPSIDRNGTYNGIFYAEVEEKTLGIYDVCSVSLKGFTFDASATPQFRGSTECTIEFSIWGIPISETVTILISGNISSDPYIDGNLEVDATALTWEGMFTDDNTLYSDFDGEFDLKGYTGTLVGYFTVEK